MRVAVSYDAGAFVRPTSALTTDELVMIGWGAEPAPHPLAHCDPIIDPAERPDGEGEMGVPVYQHP